MFGLIRKTLVFSTGTVFGVYLAQNYRLPDVGSVAGALVSCFVRASVSCALSSFDSFVVLQYKKASNDDPKK